MAGGAPIMAPAVSGGYLTGRALIFPLSLVISLFFLWGFSYGLLDVLNKHFQTVLGISKLESTGLQVMYFGGGYLLFSPVAAEVLKRRGYKFTILMGLALYSLGAILFWPVAHASLSTDNKRAIFGGFCACTLVIACGLATLETSANSYAVVIGKPETASARLQFCQSWNGVASFIGPLIASKFFFEGANANSLTNVQYVYLAVSCAGVAVAVLFFFARLPEVSEQALEEAGPSADALGHPVGQGPIYKQYNLIFAFIAQFCYVGSQVTVATWFINYAHENGGLSDSQGANFLSFALMTFTVGRFVATALATVFQSDFLLMIYAAAAIALTAYCSVGTGKASVGVLMTIFFFEAPMYPILFTLGTANLGRHTRRGAGIMVQAVAGAAVFVPIQGAIADAAHIRISYIVPLVGFTYVVGYATFHWFRHGRNIMRVKDAKHPAVETETEGGVVTIDGAEKKKTDDWVESV
ncbi:major facilitator superfamily transporter [Colletotrichum incanum]|uniref:Major facilitator superfamily transporter n=1 Tax=Colletotrichum incanum TaxID=1573173 RepID=A0A161Y021_COLIC|nr:major facilitator superfamily transporter [Colletotrichum incanum]OHW95867.1 major facilitator superfamily transporter [Colletotrichum incanum]